MCIHNKHCYLDDLPLPPPDPSGHGKQPLSREEIIVISCAGFAVVIFILILVIVIFRRKRHGKFITAICMACSYIDF